MLKNQLTVLLIGSALLAYSQSSTENDIYDLSLEELSQIAVSSSNRISPEALSEAKANVVVITRKQIEERGYISLTDLLEDVQDVKVDRAVDPRWFNNITIRGIKYSDKFIILLDGIRISSPTNEIIPIMENYSLQSLKQVEIVYGPVSALYGADAFVGVINLVTKDVDPKGSLSGFLSGGQYNTSLANIHMSTQLASGLEVSIGGQYFYDEQPDLAKFYPNTYVGRDQSLATGTFYTLLGTIRPSTPIDTKAGFPLDASSLYTRLKYRDVSLTYFQNDAHSPSSTANEPQNSVYNEDQLFGHSIKMLSGKYYRQSDKWISSTQVTYSRYNLDPLSNFRNVFTMMEPAYLYARSWKFKAEQLFTLTLSDKSRISTGITAERFYSIPRSHDLNDPVKNDNIILATITGSQAANNPQGIEANLITTSYGLLGGFMEYNFEATDELSFTIGSRVDKDKRFDLTVNPRMGIVYNKNQKLLAKVLIGSAYLAPSPQNIYDRYGILATNDGGQTYYSEFFNLPNEDLEPQTIRTAETGLKYFLFSNLSLDVSAYYSHVDNLISPVSSEQYPDRIAAIYPNNEYDFGNGRVYPINTIQINDNLGESQIYGGSFGVNYLLRNQGLNADFSAIYSFVDGTLDLDEEGIIAERNLPGIAPHQLKLISTFRFRKLTTNIRAHFVGSQRAFSVSSVKDKNNNGLTIDDTEYIEIDGFILLNTHITYKINNTLSLTCNVRNLMDQRYKNINIGIGADRIQGESARAEFNEGAPQNPVRVTAGLRFLIK